MAKTRNRYIHPIDIEECRRRHPDDKNIRMAYKESPAHQESYKNGMYKHSVDFVVPEGTQVRAAADGKVIETKSDSTIHGKTDRFDEFTNYIEIEHRNGEYSWYEHLKKNGVLVKPGERVKRGQVIGYSGETGWIAHLGPHLHFMVGKGETDKDYQTLQIVWRKRR